MQVHFIHPGRAYLPELAAYAQHIQHLGHSAQVHSSPHEVAPDARVLWWMCGRVPRNATQRWPRAFHIHEYASASVPPWPWLKDRIKRAIQPQPHYRIFQNAWLHARMGYRDAIPYELRDMGIAPAFLEAHSTARTAPPPFDAVYLGDMQRLHHFVPLLQALERIGQRVLLVGNVAPDLRQRLHNTQHLHITGTVAHTDVPALLQQARWGLNLVPAVSPYDQQTSTKLLEYCAVGLPVVSTDYAWARSFAQAQGMRFAYLPSLHRHGSSAHAVNRYAAWWAQLQGQESAYTYTGCDIHPMHSWAWPQVLQRLSVWRAAGLQP